ncbi:nucleoside phosphorylase [Halorussus marinus]|uniref:nucleoside phosphorylase n=1 Tax=Halorussus marinus TaxID=2505976 RepID=UPI00106E9B7C|nr:nucleoside phosphorylase [Halorussus marinus]
MPFPNVADKHRGDAVITPEKSVEYRDDQSDAGPPAVPEAVVLCYSRGLMEYLTDARDGREVDSYYGDLYVFDEFDGRVGVMGNFGIGAPTAAMMVEELAADGVEAFLSVGFAGCLQDDVEMGEFIVCDRAIRDEGTSHHYAESAKFARPTEPLFDRITRTLADRDEPYRVGPSWTTDAIYRETVREVESYASEGVLTVEMEASAVFTVAAHRGVDAAAMFVVSDYLGTAEWEPKFHLTEDDMRRLGDAAAEILADRTE